MLLNHRTIFKLIRSHKSTCPENGNILRLRGYSLLVSLSILTISATSVLAQDTRINQKQADELMQEARILRAQGRGVPLSEVPANKATVHSYESSYSTKTKKSSNSRNVDFQTIQPYQQNHRQPHNINTSNFNESDHQLLSDQFDKPNQKNDANGAAAIINLVLPEALKLFK